MGVPVLIACFASWSANSLPLIPVCAFTCWKAMAWLRLALLNLVFMAFMNGLGFSGFLMPLRQDRLSVCIRKDEFVGTVLMYSNALIIAIASASKLEL